MKKNLVRFRRIVCIGLALMLTMCCLGEGEDTSAPTSEPRPAQTEAPPTNTVEPTSEPDPTVAPQPETTPEPGNETEPSVDPTPEASVEPDVTSEPESSSEPTTEPSDTPTPEPTEAPDEQYPRPSQVSSNGPVITASGCVTDIRGSLVLNATSPDDSVAFSWTVNVDVSNYLLYMETASGLSFIGTQSSNSYTLSAASFSQGVNTFWVGAVTGDGAENVLWGKIMVSASPQGEGGGEFPDGFPDSFPSGMGGTGGFSGFGGFSGYSGMSGMPDMDGQDAGFRVVPGEALTDSHSSGSKIMQKFGTVTLDISDGTMTVLTIGGYCLDITAEDMSEFTATVEGDTLTLAGSDQGWQVNGYALRILNRSGIDQIILTWTDSNVTVPTDLEPEGYEYALLRADGIVSGDMTWYFTAKGTQMSANDKTYSYEKNVLAPIGG